MHDLIAELAGLRNELATCENGPRESRRAAAGQVREQIARVRGELDADAERLEQRAEHLAGAGQDVPAAGAAAAARRIREAIGQDHPQAADKSARAAATGKRTAAAAKAPQRTDGDT